ncbi:DUF4185 domain-containing protein [Parenemella sanctibonifatiensis]|uniref:DUF4185 domain-containing protein n=1 Tax=Parenemella sanctibonifatiensis TaxID=2016505 RepID=A0A255EQC7_9ACTN|nr:DUF4185 domain-containing protein [Parenemella sanctibonifatiensis]OYN90323.1 DUF4185 domain-containing protein [Parenemella sanctibonifatiensis]
MNRHTGQPDPGSPQLPRLTRRTLIGGSALTATALGLGATGPAYAARGPLARPDRPRNRRFARLGDTSGTWVGGDSTYSVPLPDGSIAWIFSDTLYGPVHDGQLSPTDSWFLHNSIVLERGGRLTAITGGTPEAPTSLVDLQPEDRRWYWFGAATLRPGAGDRADQLQVVVLEFEKTGDDAFDFAWRGNGVATIDTQTWQVTSVDDLPSDTNTHWGSWIQRQDDQVLVHGVEDLGANKYMHVARVASDNLADRGAWTFWDGTGWSPEESDSARIMVGVSNEYSVTPYAGGHLLVTQDTLEPLSARILAYRSSSPTGPFTDPVELYRTPETGAAGSYGNPNIFTYNAHEHPHLRRGNRLTISYNVNSFASDELYADVTIYRPRFIQVDQT